LAVVVIDDGLRVKAVVADADADAEGGELWKILFVVQVEEMAAVPVPES
jgi:hypothetical protein